MFVEKSAKSIIGYRRVVALMALLVVLPSVKALAAPAGQGAQSAFNSTCASCHGKNGTPTTVGKSLNAPDLGSTTVQNHTNPELQQIIGSGKGNMPAFKDHLSEAQIDSLVSYIRTFSKRHK
jgi:mono/diheme cytochrome c family protein